MAKKNPWPKERIKEVRRSCFPSTRVMQEETGLSARTIQAYEGGDIPLQNSKPHFLLFRMMEADSESFLALLEKAKELSYPKRRKQGNHRANESFA